MSHFQKNKSANYIKVGPITNVYTTSNILIYTHINAGYFSKDQLEEICLPDLNEVLLRMGSKGMILF